MRSQPTHLDPAGSEVGTIRGQTQGRPPQQRNSSELEGTLLAQRGRGGGRSAGTKQKPTGGSMAPGRGVSHAGSQGLRDQRNQPGWGCFQVFKAFRPFSVHRTHCTARSGSMSNSGYHIRSPINQLISGHSLLFPGREDLSILPLPYPPPQLPDSPAASSHGCLCLVTPDGRPSPFTPALWPPCGALGPVLRC